MKTLVTGGAGFIGSTLADALLSAGHEVAVLDDLSRGTREQVPAAARFIEADISAPALPAAVAELRPEVVFHMAAQIDVRRSVREPLYDTTVNVLGMVNLLQSCVDTGVRRVIFSSSGGTVYGDTEQVPTPEEHRIHPGSNYGAAKASSEIYGNTYAQLYGLEFVALRYANVYGPRQDPHGEAGVVAIFAQRLLRGEATVINGDGRQTRDYVYVDDVVRANLLAATTADCDAFNIATGIETDVVRIHELLAAAVGVPSTPRFGAAKPGEQLRSALAVDRARDRLGWTAQVDLEEGMRRTVDFFR